MGQPGPVNPKPQTRYRAAGDSYAVTCTPRFLCLSLSLSFSLACSQGGGRGLFTTCQAAVNMHDLSLCLCAVCASRVSVAYVHPRRKCSTRRERGAWGEVAHTHTHANREQSLRRHRVSDTIAAKNKATLLNKTQQRRCALGASENNQSNQLYQPAWS